MTNTCHTLRLVLGDQLSEHAATLSDLDPDKDIVLMAEVAEEATYVRHHPQKIVLFLSAMRHFAARLRDNGIKVRYVALDDGANTGSLGGEVARAVKELSPHRLVMMEAGEHRLLEAMRDWAETLDCAVEIRADERFLCSHEEFAAWAEGRKQLRMEYFYREMRRKSGLLMTTDGEPEGGAWNFDADNRKSLPKDYRPPERLRFEVDEITRDVIALVGDRFPDHFGRLEGFAHPVTREEALAALDHFIDTALPGFGDYQDAMKQGEPFLHHSLISPAINIGLLDPVEVCRRAEDAYHAGDAPLNAVEGFIRQIIGWREYVRGIYWRFMPDYAETNHLQADRPLPAFYWSGDTDLNCLAQAIGETRDHAYAHHIQRLMVTGTFALLIGADPAAVNKWYLEVYADAVEWVQLPNTHGMALFADGGIMASKPYAASGKYINRMSDYCAGCRYDPNRTGGKDACPLNALYWDFLMRNGERLSSNPRMGMPYRNLEKMPDDKRQALRDDAKRFLDSLYD